MKIAYSEINGKKYAYTCTSKRVPGKKNPVCVRTYLGVVDPTTGEIIPKKETNRSPAETCNIPIVRDYGDSAIISVVVNNLGLIERMEEYFGPYGHELVLIASAQALHPSDSESVLLTLDNSYIRELLHIKNINRNRIGSNKTINSIPLTLPMMYMESELRRNRRELTMFMYPATLVGDDNNPSGYSSDDYLTVAFLVDDHAYPIAFGVFHDPWMNDYGFMRLMDLIDDTDNRVRIVLDPRYFESLDIPKYILRGMDLVASVPIQSESYRHLTNQPYTTDGQDSKSMVMRSRIGIKLSGRGYQLIPETDGQFDSCGIVVNAFYEKDDSKGKESFDYISTTARSIRSTFNGINVDYPERMLRAFPGIMESFLKIQKNKDGTVKISINRNEMRRFRENAGKSLTIATSCSFDDICDIRARNATLTRVLEQYYSGSMDLMQFTGKSTVLSNQLFVEFLVIKIYSEIQRILEATDLNMTIRDALQMGSSLKIISHSGRKELSLPCKGSSKLFEAFGIDISCLPDL